jgi:hypothetical protein
MAVKMKILCWISPPFCPRKEEKDWINKCPRQIRIAKSKRLSDLGEACKQCRLRSIDEKTNPQDHPIGYGDLFQCKNGEVIKA